MNKILLSVVTVSFVLTTGLALAQPKIVPRYGGNADGTGCNDSDPTKRGFCDSVGFGGGLGLVSLFYAPINQKISEPGLTNERSRPTTEESSYDPCSNVADNNGGGAAGGSKAQRKCVCILPKQEVFDEYNKCAALFSSEIKKLNNDYAKKAAAADKTNPPICFSGSWGCRTHSAAVALCVDALNSPTKNNVVLRAECWKKIVEKAIIAPPKSVNALGKAWLLYKELVAGLKDVRRRLNLDPPKGCGSAPVCKQYQCPGGNSKIYAQ